MSRRATVTLTVLAALAALATALVTDVLHAMVLAAAVAVVVLALRVDRSRDAGWPHPPEEDRLGGRPDVSDLSWAAFTRDGRATERVLRRVRGVAVARLAAHGVRWDGELGGDLGGWGRDAHDAAQHRARADALLGPAVVAGLTTARTADPRTLDIWIRALDRLVEAPDAPRSHR